MTKNKKIFIFRKSETFMQCIFNYAPLVWIFCRKKQYLKIQKFHHKALRVVYNSNKNYDELLRNNNKISIHQSHLSALICEVFKSLNNLNPEFMWSYFVFKNTTYNIRKGPLLRLPAAKSTSYGINSVLFRACLLWNSFPQSIIHWTFDFYLIRRDLALETFRNKFSYLNHSIITSKYKFSYL